MFSRLLAWFAPPKPAPREWPWSALQLPRGTIETQAYFDADDALYNHEQPFYRYAASGFPMAFADKDYARKWEAERERLELAQKRAWDRACEAARAAKAKPIEWTEADEANERRLYEAGRSAFWLNPNRWQGVKPGELMNLEEPPMMDGHEMLKLLAGRRPETGLHLSPTPYMFGKTRSRVTRVSQGNPVSDRKPVLATDLIDGGLGYALAKD